MVDIFSLFHHLLWRVCNRRWVDALLCIVSKLCDRLMQFSLTLIAGSPPWVTALLSGIYMLQQAAYVTAGRPRTHCRRQTGRGGRVLIRSRGHHSSYIHILSASVKQEIHPLQWTPPLGEHLIVFSSRQCAQAHPVSLCMCVINECPQRDNLLLLAFQWMPVCFLQPNQISRDVARWHDDRPQPRCPLGLHDGHRGGDISQERELHDPRQLKYIMLHVIFWARSPCEPMSAGVTGWRDVNIFFFVSEWSDRFWSHRETSPHL